MRVEYGDTRTYLRETPLMDWGHPAVRRKTAELTAGLSGDAEKARCLFEWVRDGISHSKDVGARVVTRRASEVLTEGTGICYSKTMLLAAMLRVEGIPAGFCYQVLRLDPPLEGTLLHALNGVYLPSADRWVRVDSRGNTGSFDGQFGIEEERLVFPEGSEKSVLIYDTIFADPAPVVVETLFKYDDCAEMVNNLPEAL